MPITTASELANHQKIIIPEAQFTEEHEGVMRGLVTKYTLPQGAKQIYVNTYTTATASALTDGVDMTDSHQLDSSTVTLSTSEYGLKIILTDKQIRQNADDVKADAGRIAGKLWEGSSI